ncbi:hypothetical protein D3C84_975210 [compost metagenome]
MRQVSGTVAPLPPCCKLVEARDDSPTFFPWLEFALCDGGVQGGLWLAFFPGVQSAFECEAVALAQCLDTSLFGSRGSVLRAPDLGGCENSRQVATRRMT